MIVPFFFDLYEYIEQTPKLLPIYYKFVNFCTKNNFPIIAQEKFCLDPKYYRDRNYWATSKDGETTHKYRVPTNEELNKNLYLISKETEIKIINEYKKYGEPGYENLVRRSKILEERLQEIVNEVAKKGEIKAFITWVWNPSLEYIAKKNNIKVICTELSTIRYPNYNDRLCYFDFKDKYDSKNINELYSKFDYRNNVILNRKELLSLFLPKEKLDNIQKMYQIPKYKIGCVLGLKNDYFEKKYSFVDINELVSNITKVYDKNEICFRTHPDYRSDIKKYGIKIDDSASVIDFICNCENLVCNISNVAYEANLYGKSVINLSDCLPTSFGISSNVNNFEENKMDLGHLNFLTFAIYTPYDLIFDLDYINWRMTNPNINEIYQKNLEYILKTKNINLNNLKKINKKNRLEYILKSLYPSMKKKEIEKINNYGFKLVEDYIKKLEDNNNYLTNRINTIINTKGYRFLEKARKIKSMFRLKNKNK